MNFPWIPGLFFHCFQNNSHLLVKIDLKNLGEFSLARLALCLIFSINFFGENAFEKILRYFSILLFNYNYEGDSELISLV